MEEIASARRFSATRAVVQIYGTCDDCRTGRKTAPIDGATAEIVFARDALRMAIATERSGLEFYTRAATLTKDQRGRAVFQELAAEEGQHLGVLEARYRELTAKDPQLESRPTFLFLKGAANVRCRHRTAARRRRDDAQALLIGIKCERGSHKFFKRYGERFEDSEGKQVFLEFADEERAHLDLLIREYRSLRERQGRRRTRRGILEAKTGKSRKSKESEKPARAKAAASARSAHR
jgi:rubrerythrin